MCVHSVWLGAPGETHRACLTCCVRDQSRTGRCHSAWINSTGGNTAERDVELIYFVFVPQFKTHCSDRCRTSKTSKQLQPLINRSAGGVPNTSHTRTMESLPHRPAACADKLDYYVLVKVKHPSKQCLTTSLQVSDMTCSLVLKVQVSVCMNNTGREILCAKWAQVLWCWQTVVCCSRNSSLTVKKR